MKTCIEIGCNSPQFGGGLCKYHQYKRRMRDGDLYKPKPRVKKPPRESKKRKEEHVRYSQQIKMFWEESVTNKTNYCFFCGELMKKRDSIHHTRGRTGDYYLDKDWWVNAHNSCHLMFHSQMVEKLEEQSWYTGFLERLLKLDQSLYDKQTGKKEKSNKLNPKLWEDTEDLL